jgi:uncharacterized Fe-S cluster-containing radical SAM superfamily protein
MRKIWIGEMTRKICLRPLQEVVVLSDGRITTCCVDRKGVNTFASIYDDDFDSTFSLKFQNLKQKFARNIANFPLCLQCFWLRRNYYNDFHKRKPSTKEISAFLDPKALPKGLVIEMTSFCNLKCGNCISGSKKLKKYRQSKFIDDDKLRKWLQPGIKKINKVRLYNYGETFLHPGAIDFCSFLTRENPAIHVSIATNLIPLNTEEKIDKLLKAQPNVLIVSLHGAGQNSVSKFMGQEMNFQSVLETMKLIIKKRQENKLSFPFVLWKYLLLKFNDSDEEMRTAQTICEEHGIDFLGFDIARGRYASKRFHKGSEDFENLKKSKYYIKNAAREIAKQKSKRIVIDPII